MFNDHDAYALEQHVGNNKRATLLEGTENVNAGHDALICHPAVRVSTLRL